MVRWEGYTSGEDTFEPLSNLEGNIVFQKWREARAGRTAAAIGSPAWRQPWNQRKQWTGSWAGLARSVHENEPMYRVHWDGSPLRDASPKEAAAEESTSSS